MVIVVMHELNNAGLVNKIFKGYHFTIYFFYGDHVHGPQSNSEDP